MLRAFLLLLLITSTQAMCAQSTLIKYLRHMEPIADSIMATHFEDCFRNNYVTMNIKDCQINHAQGKYVTWDQLVDSSKIKAYRFYYLIAYDSVASLYSRVTLELDSVGNPIHDKFKQPLKLYRDQPCDLKDLKAMKKIAIRNKLKGDPEDWSVYFFLNGAWNDFKEKAKFELHLFRYYGGKSGKKKFQGHIYNLANGQLLQKTKGKVK